MFERFTDRSRRTLVVAQEEARQRGHNFIGTEHVLLGVLADKAGLAHRSLVVLAVDIDAVLGELETRMAASAKSDAVGSPPFTPKAKQSLEKALGESVRLGHGYIGTEHLLLGLLGVPDGWAAEVLVAKGVQLDEVRRVVVDLLVASPPPPASAPGSGKGETRLTPAAETALNGARRRAGDRPVGSHDLMAALLYSDRSAAAVALLAAGFDLDALRSALERAVTLNTSDQTPEETLAAQIEIGTDGDRVVLRLDDPSLLAALQHLGSPSSPETGLVPDPRVAHDLGGIWQHIHTALGQVVEKLAAPPPETTSGSASSAQGS